MFLRIHDNIGTALHKFNIQSRALEMVSYWGNWI